jgi:hypothetical protein
MVSDDYLALRVRLASQRLQGSVVVAQCQGRSCQMGIVHLKRFRVLSVISGVAVGFGARFDFESAGLLTVLIDRSAVVVQRQMPIILAVG